MRLGATPRFKLISELEDPNTKLDCYEFEHILMQQQSCLPMEIILSQVLVPVYNSIKRKQ